VNIVQEYLHLSKPYFYFIDPQLGPDS
jgi:hypothetical protein